MTGFTLVLAELLVEGLDDVREPVQLRLGFAARVGAAPHIDGWMKSGPGRLRHTLTEFGSWMPILTWPYCSAAASQDSDTWCDAAWTSL